MFKKNRAKPNHIEKQDISGQTTNNKASTEYRNSLESTTHFINMIYDIAKENIKAGLNPWTVLVAAIRLL